jgi:hypothetical protein
MFLFEFVGFIRNIQKEFFEIFKVLPSQSSMMVSSSVQAGAAA